MNKSTQKGVTLIELMIAVALGAIVIIGVASSLSSMNLSNNTQVTQNNIQQDSKLVLDFYETQIRKSASSVLNNLSSTLRKHIIVNTQATTASGNPNPRPLVIEDFIAGAIAEQDNSLTIIYTGNKYSLNALTPQTFTDARTFRIDQSLPTRYTDGTRATFMITDGERVDIFDATIRISNGQPPSITPLTGLSQTYKIADAVLSPLSFVNFSVNAPNFIERDLTFGRANIIATNVDAIGYVFSIDRALGGDIDGSVDMFATHANILANPSLSRGIMAADVYLLTRDSENRIDVTLPRASNYSLPDPTQAITATRGAIPMRTLSYNDKIPRKLFRRTITMRNKARILN